jgi:hypothetical protein
VLRATSKAILREVIALAILMLIAVPAAAQVYAEYNYVFSPPNPMPGDNVSVFIRGTDPVNGFVFCPERALIITGVHIDGSSIVLDLAPAGFPGGIIRPYCDGNTVSLGPLPGGLYAVTARPVFPSGAIGPVAVSGLLAVGMPVPVFSPLLLSVYAALVALTGMFYSPLAKRIHQSHGKT